MTGFHSFRIGDVIVTALSDGEIEVSPEIAGRSQADNVRRIAASLGLPAKQQISVNAFAIHSKGHTTLIDTGAGDKLAPSLGRLPQSLAEAGIEPEDVNTVLLTHMHPDHSNGLTDASGHARFPNAELVMHENEFSHWLNDERMAQASEGQRVNNFEAARRESVPYRKRIRLFRDGEVVPDVRALPLPGHTPGHTGYVVGFGDNELLIWGDIVHLPEVQLARPEISVTLDSDRDAAVATRKRILTTAAEDKRIVTGMHLHFPGFARVVNRSNGFALQNI
jgi:glyoxylase-like metal-dependent hydrolase (beta-lactamase superfamily II)